MQNLNDATAFVVDDDIDLCQSIRWLLESVDLKVKIFNNGFEFLENFDFNKEVGCILLDIRMPMISGLEMQEKLNEKGNTLPIIFMTAHGDIPMAVRAMKAGAFNFLTKPFNDQVMLDHIQKAISLGERSLSKNKFEVDINKRFLSLTKREYQVLDLVVEGKLNKEIAHALNISIKTVELHRSNIMQKMKAKTIAELVKFHTFLNNRKISA